jgi:hypothetical protein
LRVQNGPSPGWQTIESVPSDESVLVYTPRWGAIIAEHSSEYGEWLSRMQCPVSLKEDDEQPSHWMPLPLAPHAEEQALLPLEELTEVSVPA